MSASTAPHIAGDERGEDIVVRHQDGSFLSDVLTSDAHQDVEELRIARVGMLIAGHQKCDRVIDSVGWSRRRCIGNRNAFVETAPDSIHAEVSTDDDRQNVVAGRGAGGSGSQVSCHKPSLVGDTELSLRPLSTSAESSL